SEDREAYHEKSFSSEGDSEPAADRQDDGIRYQVRCQHPRALVVACAEVSSHVWQRDIRNAGVEDFHERGYSNDNRNEPRVVLWLARRLGRFEVFVWVGPRRCTLGTTLMPGRSWRSPFCPESRMIFTGILWTILT